jgi:hypothetical protein
MSTTRNHVVPKWEPDDGDVWHVGEDLFVFRNALGRWRAQHFVLDRPAITLRARSAKTARAEAVEIVRERLTEMLAALPENGDYDDRA